MRVWICLWALILCLLACELKGVECREVEDCPTKTICHMGWCLPETDPVFQTEQSCRFSLSSFPASSTLKVGSSTFDVHFDRDLFLSADWFRKPIMISESGEVKFRCEVSQATFCAFQLRCQGEQGLLSLTDDYLTYEISFEQFSSEQKVSPSQLQKGFCGQTLKQFAGAYRITIKTTTRKASSLDETVVEKAYTLLFRGTSFLVESGSEKTEWKVDGKELCKFSSSSNKHSFSFNK